jgi:16S rRNA (cytidine1402-2'-O)-methyltransferase
MPGSLTVCPTPIGNMDDVSKRVREALVAADYIACEDTRRTGKLLELMEISPKPRMVSNHEGSSEVTGSRWSAMPGCRRSRTPATA